MKGIKPEANALNGRSKNVNIALKKETLIEPVLNDNFIVASLIISYFFELNY
ncbi:hypothetical protein THMIRHAM_06860 [Thiomicrorhabdus immobilis]|uniref:Uncharacterized protein n=1 Tax=Thiomicrorhabdus immobilis TaxID=2791037 RepID=A0ABM7MC16_9GAMM|nr:hypothetical protein THMIRHAM_06860 [Thiomicrorhabdus immobilis]